MGTEVSPNRIKRNFHFYFRKAVHVFNKMDSVSYHLKMSLHFFRIGKTTDEDNILTVSFE